MWASKASRHAGLAGTIQTPAGDHIGATQNKSAGFSIAPVKVPMAMGCRRI
jgi:hypothetical protein